MNNLNLRLVSLILLIITIIWIILKLHTHLKVESFDNSVNIQVNFIKVSPAKSIIKKNHQSYFRQLQPMELVARNVLKKESDYQQPNIISTIEDFYCSQILEFSIEEETLFRQLIIETISKCSYKQLHKYFRDWNIIKVSDLFEDGLPHTIDKYIIIPENFVSDVINLISQGKHREAIISYGSTLSHEQIHVLQRVHPKIFSNLYTQFWNYTMIPENKMNPVIDNYVDKYQRLNPDGLNNNYWFQLNKNELLMVYVKLKTYSLEDVSKLALIINSHDFKVIETNPLNNYSKYLTYFGNIGNNYHPNELVATLLSEYIMLSNYYGNTKVQKCLAISQLKKWIETL